MADTPRVTVPVEDLLFYKLKDLILEQSEGEWTDEMIVRDAHHFANHIRPLLSAAPAPEGGAVMKACADFQEAIDYFEADVADAMAEESERADLWDREVTVNIDALKVVMRAALATREEAPAEAWESLHPHAQPFEQYPELALHIERMAMSGVVGSMISWDAFLRELNAALRAKPPAREDAQPVACSACRECGCNFFAHPVPDALRVAVEALEKIKAVRVCKESANIWTGADACRKIATEALAALQAEQKGGA